MPEMSEARLKQIEERSMSDYVRELVGEVRRLQAQVQELESAVQEFYKRDGKLEFVEYERDSERQRAEKAEAELESTKGMLDSNRSERRGLLGLVRAELEEFVGVDNLPMLELVAAVCKKADAAMKEAPDAR